jgi:hypothetical protein
MRSRGIEQSLESIAGAPRASLLGSGSMTVPAGDNALSPISLYYVYRSFGTNINDWSQIATLGSQTPYTGLRLQTYNAGDVGYRTMIRTDTDGGTTNNGTTLNGGRTPGLHVISIVIPAGCASMRTRFDQGAVVDNRAIPAGNGIIRTSLGANSSADGAGLRSLYYNAEHTTDQVRRIEAWLLRRHYFEAFTIQEGPNDPTGNAGGPAGTYSVLGATAGLTGKTASRMTRNGAAAGYGCFIKAGRPAGSRPIPAGVKVLARVWVRASQSTVRLEVANDANTYQVTPVQDFAVTAGTWTMLEWTFTTLQPWRTTEFLRTGNLSAAAAYIDYSDASFAIIS